MCTKKVSYALVKYYHERFGHFAVERLFLTLFSMIYWRNMHMDIRDFCQTCDTCLQAKRDYSHKTRLLNPLQVAEGPFHTWAIDHKDFCRKTTGDLLQFSVVSIVSLGGQFWHRFLVWMQKRLPGYFLKR